MSIRRKVETDLPVVCSGGNDEVMFQQLSVAIENGIDSWIHLRVDNLPVVGDVGAPAGGIVSQQIIALAGCERASVWNCRRSSYKSNLELAGTAAV